MKKYNNFLASLLALSLSLTFTFPAFASDIFIDKEDNSVEHIEYQNNKDEDFVNATNVFAKLKTIYKVTIPKTVVLSGIEKKASYYVNVTGDIAGYESVNVIPEKEFNLFADNKDAQKASVDQNETVWTFDTLNKKANGTITAPGITAGKWTGMFNFDINLENKEETQEHNHSWLLSVNANATCTEDSIEVYKCSVCGETKITHDAKKTGHIIDEEKDIITPASCTKQGFTTHTCKSCEKTFIDTFTDALGHEYNDEGVCIRCGDFNIDTLSSGLYAINSSNDKTTYTSKYTWQELINKGIFKVNSNGLLILNGINKVTRTCQYRSEFENCLLVLDNSVKQVNCDSFYKLRELKGVYIPESVNVYEAGWENYGLENIYLSKNNRNFVLENGALYTKDYKSLLYAVSKGVENISIKEGCEIIKQYAIAFSTYNEVTIPDSVKEIESGALRNSNITTINIPKNTINIASNFVSCCYKLENIIVDSQNPNYASFDGIMYSKDMKTFIACGAGKTGTLSLPDTVTKIERSAADGCSKLSEIIIPNSVAQIGEWAFSDCSSVTNIKIPDNDKYTEIGTGTFSGCGGTEIVIPKNIKIINRGNFGNNKTSKITFEDNTSLWKLELESGGTAVSGVPTAPFIVDNAAQNAKFFKTYKYYKWIKQ